MFARIEPDGVRWADGRFEQVDAILWATGFRPAVNHLAPLHLRSPLGGIQLAPAPPRSPTLGSSSSGYGPSASTIGANRAGRAAAIAVARAFRRGCLRVRPSIRVLLRIPVSLRSYEWWPRGHEYV